jgi:hypothetical protein
MPKSGYKNKRTGEWVDTESLALAPSQARTADGNGPTFELGRRTTLQLDLEVTAVSGTNPSLSVAVQTSHDGSSWREHGAFTQKVAAGSQRFSLAGLDRYVRVAWGILGTTPSFTFSVSADAL